MIDWRKDSTEWDRADREPERSPPFDPAAAARLLIGRRYSDNKGRCLIRHYRGAFLRWRDGWWSAVEDCDIRSEITAMLLEAQHGPGSALRGRILRPVMISDVIAMLRDLPEVSIPSDFEMPGWLGQEAAVDRPPARDFVPMLNGLLHLRSGELWPADPMFFALGGIDVAFDPEASAPAWQRFLRELWGDDEASIRALQEFAGYIMSADVRQQKALLQSARVGPAKGRSQRSCGTSPDAAPPSARP